MNSPCFIIPQNFCKLMQSGAGSSSNASLSLCWLNSVSPCLGLACVWCSMCKEGEAAGHIITEETVHLLTELKLPTKKVWLATKMFGIVTQLVTSSERMMRAIAKMMLVIPKVLWNCQHIAQFLITLLGRCVKKTPSFYTFFHSHVQNIHSPNLVKEKCMSEVVISGSMIICYLSKLWKAKFFLLCDVIFLVRLQGKIDIDHSWEGKGQWQGSK